LTLVDDDVVHVENLGAQRYKIKDLNTSKVYAATVLCRRINPDLQVTSTAERF
jgi:tRNA A37 threonylcarbamoyladenosine dehydratase